MSTNKKIEVEIRILAGIPDQEKCTISNMPVRIKKIQEKDILVSFPLLADLQTWANSDQDIVIAVKEAMTLFFNSCMAHGKGICVELTSLNWQLKKRDKISTVFAFNSIELIESEDVQLKTVEIHLNKGYIDKNRLN